MSAHCWHLSTTYSNIAGGDERDVCCWCGTVRIRAWTNHLNPEHGKYVSVRYKLWKMTPDMGDCDGQKTTTEK